MKPSYVYCVFIYLFLVACESSNDRIKRNIEEMSSNPITIPFEKMKCMTSDSLLEKSPWKYAKIKLVHYIDSMQCSTCYLQKIMKKDKTIFHLEKETDNEFFNIFIVDPRSNKSSITALMAQYSNKEIPTTLFVDTAHVFIDINSTIPEETMYHTFLLDEKNNVIFVGNPLVSKEMKEKVCHIINKRLKQTK